MKFLYEVGVVEGKTAKKLP